MIRRVSLLTVCLLFAATVPLLAQEAQESYMFQTVLLLGSTEGQSNLEGVPGNVTAALDDVTKFLPYKNYRLIDASILRSSGEARGRLTGSDGPEFDLGFQFRAGEGDTLLIRNFGIDTLVAQPQDRVVMENGKSRVEHQPPSWVRKNVIGTSFTVKVGETIVVGSSKLNGSGEAIIVLFTAMR